MMIHKRKRWLYQAWVGQGMFLWVDPTIISFWNLKTRSLLRKGLNLFVLVQKGSILDDSRLDLWCFNPKFSAALPREPLRNLNANIVTTSFSSRKLPQTLSNFLKCFLPTKYPKTWDFKLKSSFLFHSPTNTPKTWFLSWIFSLFSFSSFHWNIKQ